MEQIQRIAKNVVEDSYASMVSNRGIAFCVVGLKDVFTEKGNMTAYNALGLKSVVTLKSTEHVVSARLWIQPLCARFTRGSPNTSARSVLSMISVCIKNSLSTARYVASLNTEIIRRYREDVRDLPYILDI